MKKKAEDMKLKEGGEMGRKGEGNGVERQEWFALYGNTPKNRKGEFY